MVSQWLLNALVYSKATISSAKTICTTGSLRAHRPQSSNGCFISTLSREIRPLVISQMSFLSHLQIIAFVFCSAWNAAPTRSLNVSLTNPGPSTYLNTSSSTNPFLVYHDWLASIKLPDHREYFLKQESNSCHITTGLLISSSNQMANSSGMRTVFSPHGNEEI